MKVLVILLSGLLIACGTARQEEEAAILDAQISEMFKTVEAKVIYEPFVNKAGKLIEGAGDYFLVYDNQSWFIKFSAGSVLREDIAKLKDQTAKFSLAEMEGLWDTDDPNIQSRVGKYVAIYEIIPY